MTKHVAALDGLRAVSIAFVIYAHLCIAGMLPKAIHATSLALDGVLIFFVISGYLITGQLRKEKEQTGTIDICRFWLRRAFRLLPASFLLIFVTWIIGRLGYLTTEPRAFLHAVTYTMDYYHPLTAELQHLWSLAVEEQFYLLWPFAALLAGVRGSKGVCIAVMVICPCFRLWGWYLEGIDRVLVFRRFDMVADAIAVGCLLALTEEKLPKWIRSNVALAVSFVVILATGLAASRMAALTIAQVSVDGICAAVIIHSLNNEQLWSSRVLGWAPLPWLGTISYSLYLWQELFMLRRGASLVYTLPGMMTCAMASYYLVERPIRLWGRRFRLSEAKAMAHFKVAA